MSDILFLTTAHHYNDDRIFYHQAKALQEAGHRVKICSLSSEFKGITDGIWIESYSVLTKSTSEKKKILETVCENFRPDCMICSEPLAVIAARKYRKKRKTEIIYDITEWYPSMRMVEKFRFPMNLLHAFKFFMIQLYAGFLSTGYIFGENAKKFPLAYFFPFKKSLLLPYYPDEQYIHQHLKKPEKNKITLCYTGQFSEEKGIGNFFAAADQVRKKKPDLAVSLLLIGGCRKEKDEQYFSELLSEYRFERISIRKSASFETFTEAYAEADLCFDLRTLNFENDHCLPIKIFYYAASGKPVIYTNLKATGKQVNVSEFGYLVDPEDSGKIADLVIRYAEDPELYKRHSRNARAAYERQYNWKSIKGAFVNFIQNSLP